MKWHTTRALGSAGDPSVPLLRSATRGDRAAAPNGPTEHLVPGHVFVDESKQRDYLLVAATVPPGALDSVRRSLRALVMPGQRRLHMTKEGDARRGVILILDAIIATGVGATVYNAGRSGRRELAARAACLRAVVTDIAVHGHQLLVVEQDDSLLQHDRRALYAAVHAAGCQDRLRYEHRRAEQELLLAVPDAIAWCWAKGGHWREKVRPVITQIRTVDPS